MKTLERFVSSIIQFRIAIIVCLTVLMAFSGYQTINHLRIDNSLSIWFLENDPSYKAYIDFQKEFGSDEIFVGMFPVENAIGKQEKKKLLQLHEAIDTLSYVKTSFSIAKAQYPLYANNSIKFEDVYNTNRSEKGLKSVLSKLPNMSSQLVTKDFKHQFFYIQLNPTPSIETKRKDLLGEITTLIEQNYDDYYLTGPPVLNEAYSKGIYKESLVFGGLTVLFITLMLLFMLPSKRYLLVSLISVAVPVSLLFGLITSMGYALNMISMLIPTILMVYSVSDAVHIINIYHKEGLQHLDQTKTQLLAITIKKSFTPCFYTTLTTFVGYFALYLSPLPAFKNMGVFTCIGLILSFILVYVIAIIGFSFMNSEFKTTKPILEMIGLSQSKFIDWLNVFTTKSKTKIILVFTVLLIYGLYAVFQVKIDTNSQNLLAEGKAKQDLRVVEGKLNGSSRMQLDISAKNGDLITNTEALKQLEKFQSKLENNLVINAPISVVNIKKFLEQRTPVLFQSNVSQDAIKNTLSKVDTDRNSFFKLFSDDLSSAGITISFKEMKTSELEKLIADIQSDFKATFNTETYQLKINGFAVVFAQLNNFILQTQFRSFFAAFFVAFLCLLIFIKNVKTTILVLIPNMLPLAILAILMSWLNIPLDVTTAMITPIMLGIAMDDTIHLVYKYRKTKGNSASPEERMDSAMRYTGSALISTTFALVAGFLIIASSATPSVRDFGLLCAVTVAVALITDLFYLPALLKRFDK
ncbi:efflux RND transporter permease subunit [Aurantibacter aestuarii]|uniref:RND transporter n=1 Tax=Aurantibacter aestuarii TaxID=1266046 RepID=A0A2T1ND34_9FLAO|nr:MMPL family transporter [Aurantibacter aestuarii]PSG90352.1 RND transporter [Aurantibacter aestuarii]